MGRGISASKDRTSSRLALRAGGLIRPLSALSVGLGFRTNFRRRSLEDSVQRGGFVQAALLAANAPCMQSMERRFSLQSLAEDRRRQASRAFGRRRKRQGISGARLWAR